jgi:hypothetical protein
VNDFELHSKLKKVPVPERAEDYWNEFPIRVQGQLRQRSIPVDSTLLWPPRLAWQFAVGVACFFLGLLALNQPLHAVSTAVMQKEIALRHQLNALPKNLRLLMTDEHGLQYLIADKE